MVLRRNSNLIALACLVALATPATAQNYEPMSRSDFISLSAGDAKRANIAIQTPTPWPWYLNRTTIHGRGKRGADLMEKYLNSYAPATQSSGNTTININPPAQ